MKHMGLEVHQDGVEKSNSLEWQSAVASDMIEVDINFVVHMEEILETTCFYIMKL